MSRPDEYTNHQVLGTNLSEQRMYLTNTLDFSTIRAHNEGVHIQIANPYAHGVDVLGKNHLNDIASRLRMTAETQEVKYAFWRSEKQLRVRFPGVHSLNANTCVAYARQLRAFLLLPDAFGPMRINYIAKQGGVTYGWDPEDGDGKDAYISLNLGEKWYVQHRDGKKISTVTMTQ